MATAAANGDVPAVRDRRAERRLMLEAIIDDPHASHSDRLRADEQLQALDREDARRAAVAERLTPEQAKDEFGTLVRAVEAMQAIERAATPEDIEPPATTVEDLQEVVDLQQQLIDALEARLSEYERALQRLTEHRQLSAAPPQVPV